ncbi:MAG: archease [Deltaproteobacteria bacterium]|nr:archease [Deltaproteobacteria bacterium]
MTTKRKPYHLIPHTGDLGMEVWGKDPADLFAQAGWSFFDIMIETGKIELRQERLVEVEAPDREALLVAWLGELLYIFEIERLALGRFSIQAMTFQTLSAQGWGEPLDPQKHQIKTVIKAVTYHQLRIWEAKGLWRARVIFDL